MNSRALVFGLGRSGKAAKALLERDGVSVAALDGDAQVPKGAFDFAIVSPGIALTHPWIVEAKRRGIPLKSELQLGCEALKRQGWKLLAVTGSKGKSSVVKVVADAINLGGQHAVACGNYGVPVCEVALEGKCGWAVVEVSSFMMETTELPADTFEAATLLNLQEDHLDRHGSVEVYHALKRKLMTMAKVPLDLSCEHSWFDLWKHGLDGGDEYYGGSYFDNEILAVNGEAAVRLMGEVTPRLGAKTIRRAFAEFVPLPHRMSRVAEIGGVRYVDDSKATSVAALVAGVKMAWGGPSGLRRLACRFGFPKWRRRVRLVAGGLAKGDDPKAALPCLTERVKKVYLIGTCAEEFSAAWCGSVDCEICGTLERATEAAMREAAKGETVLLSPGTASFDQFKSFGERGDVFARLVQKGKIKQMKKLAVVLGVAAVATFTGCRDQDYDAKHGKQVQDEVKTIETTPTQEVTTTTTVETTTIKTTEVKVEPPTCKCAPGTVHAAPCACGASDCKCTVAPPEPETTVYVVQNGDYLAKISKKYNVTISSIKRLNDLKDDKIRVGQKLKLPGKIDLGAQPAPVTATTKTTTTKKTGFAPYAGATKEYVVKSGDTLGSVAYGNGINIRQLKQLNNLTSDSLKIGQKLKIPAEKVTKVAAKVEPAKAVETAAAPAPVKVEPVKPAEPAPVVPAPTADVAPAPATPAPAETTPAPAPVATTTYVVQEGEDLTRLSIDFGVSTSVIREMNNLGENDTIKPGQVLKLPAESQQ